MTPQLARCTVLPDVARAAHTVRGIARLRGLELASVAFGHRAALAIVGRIRAPDSQPFRDRCGDFVVVSIM